MSTYHESDAQHLFGLSEFTLSQILQSELQQHMVQQVGTDLSSLLRPEFYLADNRPELFVLPRGAKPALPDVSRQVKNLANSAWKEYLAQAQSSSHKLGFEAENQYNPTTSLTIYATYDELLRGLWEAKLVQIGGLSIPLNIVSYGRGRYAFEKLPPPTVNAKTTLSKEISILERIKKYPNMWTDNFNKRELRVNATNRLSTEEEINHWRQITTSYIGNPRNIGLPNTFSRSIYSGELSWSDQNVIGIRQYDFRSDDGTRYRSTETLEPVQIVHKVEPIGWLIMHIFDDDAGTLSVTFQNTSGITPLLSER
jgi:hypothetical protein